jgi:hypothetical protein
LFKLSQKYKTQPCWYCVKILKPHYICNKNLNCQNTNNSLISNLTTVTKSKQSSVYWNQTSNSIFTSNFSKWSISFLLWCFYFRDCPPTKTAFNVNVKRLLFDSLLSFISVLWTKSYLLIQMCFAIVWVILKLKYVRCS